MTLLTTIIIVLKYVSDILLEDDIEDKPCMMQDCLALQAAEKSFYEVLNQKDPPSLNKSIDNSDDFRQSCHSSNDYIAGKTNWVGDHSEISSHVQSSFGECLSDTLGTFLIHFLRCKVLRVLEG